MRLQGRQPAALAHSWVADQSAELKERARSPRRRTRKETRWEACRELEIRDSRHERKEDLDLGSAIRIEEAILLIATLVQGPNALFQHLSIEIAAGLSVRLGVG